ncbi:hypothetical protein B7463_g10618, partial [Scytalidium lignicola]
MKFRAEGHTSMSVNWLNKPDGGRGWASLFLERGYRVYIVDSNMRGRSPDLDNNNELRKPSIEFVEMAFTAGLFLDVWVIPIFGAYYASVVPSLANREYQQATLQKAGAALLDRIGHSRPALVHAVVALELAGPLFEGKVLLLKGFVRPYGLTTILITYSPPVTDPVKDLVRQTINPSQHDQLPLSIQAEDPPSRQLVNFLDTPVLLVTAEASYHAPYDWATVVYLRQAGVKKTEHLVLVDRGIRGNGHMFFMEKNSDEIALLIDVLESGPSATYEP